MRGFAALALLVVLGACSQYVVNHNPAGAKVDTGHAKHAQPNAAVAPPKEAKAQAQAPHAGTKHAPLPASAPPQQVRFQLEQLLGQHAVLAVRLMRGQLNKSPDFLEAATAALGHNTTELSAVVASSYGTAGGEKFKQLWTQHVSALFAYSKALADKDKTAKQKAMADLDAYTKEYGEFISTATKGELPAEAVTESVNGHIHHLIAQIDAYAAGDYKQAYKLEREAYAAMFSTGKGLAGATVSARPGELPAGFDDPPQQLRSALGQLLGEHSELVVDVTRAALAKSPEFSQAALALDGNTRELGQAINAVFGANAADQFGDLWADHVNAVVAFTTAVVEKDPAGEAKARTSLDQWGDKFGSFLASAVKDKKAATAFVEVAHHHDEQLLTSITSFQDGDYAKAHQITYEGYQFMFAIADNLAKAIESGTAKQMPKGGAATGGGGAAAGGR